MFPPTLLSCSSRFLRALQQNRAQSRLLYLLNYGLRRKSLEIRNWLKITPGVIILVPKLTLRNVKCGKTNVSLPLRIAEIDCRRLTVVKSSAICPCVWLIPLDKRQHEICEFRHSQLLNAVPSQNLTWTTNGRENYRTRLRRNFDIVLGTRS